MSRTDRYRPRELAPEPWPHEPASDPVAELARQFALRLTETIGDRSIRSVAAEARVSHVTVLNILAGKVWPDLETIGRLEYGLNADLYPGRGQRRRR